jgi:hypothetical protein
VNKTYRYDPITQAGQWVEFNEVLTLTRNISRLFQRDARCTAGIVQMQTRLVNGTPWTYNYQVGILSDTQSTVYSGVTALYSFSNGSAFTSPWAAALQPRSDLQNTHMLYRYVGNANRQGDPTQGTPKIISGRVSISSNTAVLRRISRMKIYHIAATGNESLVVDNTRTIVTGDSYEVVNDDLTTDFPPEAPGPPAYATLLAEVFGPSEFPSSGQPDYDYVFERDIVPFAVPPLPEGTIVVEFEGTTFTDSASTQEDVDITFQLTIDNAF